MQRLIGLREILPYRFIVIAINFIYITNPLLWVMLTVLLDLTVIFYIGTRLSLALGPC